MQSYPTRRIMFNYYYDFLYVPIYAINRSNSGSTSSITLNTNEFSFYAYEFNIDDRNIGGTLHLDLESRMMVQRKNFLFEIFNKHMNSIFSHMYQRISIQVFSFVYRDIASVLILNVKMIIKSFSTKIPLLFVRFPIQKWVFGIYHSNIFVIKPMPIVKMVHYH